MNRETWRTKKISLFGASLLIFFLLMIVGGSSCGPPKKTLLVQWEPPEFGSSPESYIVHIHKNNRWIPLQGEFVNVTTLKFKVEAGKSIKIRVRAKDMFHRLGPWSEDSNLYIVRNGD